MTPTETPLPPLIDTSPIVEAVGTAVAEQINDPAFQIFLAILVAGTLAASIVGAIISSLKRR